MRASRSEAVSNDTSGPEIDRQSDDRLWRWFSGPRDTPHQTRKPTTAAESRPAPVAATHGETCGRPALSRSVRRRHRALAQS